MFLKISQNSQENTCEFCEICKGEDTLWNISFRLIHETQFNVYFIKFNLISWNSCKICEDVEGFTTDTILLTATCSWFCTILLVIFNVSL